MRLWVVAPSIQDDLVTTETRRTRRRNQETSGALCDSVVNVLRAGGCISLAEPAPRHTQRLYGLVNLTELGEGLAAKVRDAEEAIYADPNDPLVNWAEDDLRAAFLAANLTEVSVEGIETVVEARISPGQLDRWFSPATFGERPSYVQRLASVLNRRDRRGRGALPPEVDRRGRSLAISDSVCGGEAGVKEWS